MLKIDGSKVRKVKVKKKCVKLREYQPCYIYPVIIIPNVVVCKYNDNKGFSMFNSSCVNYVTFIL